MKRGVLRRVLRPKIFPWYAMAALLIWRANQASYSVLPPHPLYAGTMLVGVGLLWMGGGSTAPWLLGAGLLFFFLHYLPYKERIESARLERRYGDAYRRYRGAVHALLPSLRPWSDPELARDDGWSAERVRANNEDGAALAVALAAAVVLLQPVLTAALRRLLGP